MILSKGADHLLLPDNLQWANRYTQTTLAVAQSRGVTGKLLRAESAKLYGTLISLRQPAPNMGVVTLATVRQIQAWANIPNQDFVWTYFGQDYAVRFAPDPIKTAEPLLGWTYNEPDELWRLEFDLITVG